jgi:uncharacterized membrane protein
MPTSYFQRVRLYAAIESIVFSALLVAWIGGLAGAFPRHNRASEILGWIHGFGWIVLCAFVLWGFFRRIFPGPLLAATVSPLGPVGSTAGLEYLARRRRRAGSRAG